MVNTARGHLDWKVLVTTEWSDDLRPVSKLNHILRVWWEEALQNGDAAIEDRCAFPTSFGVYKHLVVLYEVGMDALNIRG
jgi:hypothetical protein